MAPGANRRRGRNTERDRLSIPLHGTIGILGGGQLGRMLALAAAELGFKTHIFAPEADSPAAQVSAAFTQASYEDTAALGAFAAAVDVITYEFENIPAATVRHLARLKPTFPSADALEITQDRLKEKDFVRSLGGGTAPYRAVDSVDDAQAAAAELGLPLVLKTRRFGYDGKGQVIVRRPEDLAAGVAQLGTRDLIAEGFVAFEREVSVVLARGQDGRVAAYPLVENRHEHHILAETIAPADASPALAQAAEALARQIIEKLQYVGVLAVEMFVVGDGVLVNELAPRVHNSGHWTLDACAVSQFEQHIRAICGLALGDPTPHSRAVMRNLLGDDIFQGPTLLAEPNACLHDYGKREARPGRKMGHVTWLYPLK